MRLTQLHMLDWEPCVLKFIFGLEPPVPIFQNFVEGWFKNRPALGTCSCEYRYARLQQEADQPAYIVKAEWMCERCAQELANAVEREFPSLQRVELGFVGESQRTDTLDFIRVPNKTVELEDGRRIPVAAFSIARRPVTIGEYEKICYQDRLHNGGGDPEERGNVPKPLWLKRPGSSAAA